MIWLMLTMLVRHEKMLMLMSGSTTEIAIMPSPI